mmetsp:Transcript_8544/g.27192  ORF Transcript_8544/g.27192 Transcript_8544/m.27192 type:complete len:668 (-) Transcript_8544:77-2080(-)
MGRAEAVDHLGKRVVGHRVVGLPRVAVEAGERREDDQVAQRASLGRRERLQHVGEAANLDAVHGVEVGRLLLLDVLVAQHTGRVHDAGHLQAVLRLDGAHRRGDLGGVVGVARHVHGAPAARLDLPLRLEHLAAGPHLPDELVEALWRRLWPAPRRKLGLHVRVGRFLERLARVGHRPRPRRLLLDGRAADQDEGAAADALGERAHAERRDAARAARDEEHVGGQKGGAGALARAGREQLLGGRSVALAARAVPDLAQRAVGAADLALHQPRRRLCADGAVEIDAAAKHVGPLERERLDEAEDGAALRTQDALQPRLDRSRRAGADAVDNAEAAVVIHARDADEEAAADLAAARRHRLLQVRLQVLCGQQRPAELRVVVAGAGGAVLVDEAGGGAVLRSDGADRRLERSLRGVLQPDGGGAAHLHAGPRQHDDVAVDGAAQRGDQLGGERRPVIDDEDGALPVEADLQGQRRRDGQRCRVGHGHVGRSRDRVVSGGIGTLLGGGRRRAPRGHEGGGHVGRGADGGNGQRPGWSRGDGLGAHYADALRADLLEHRVDDLADGLRARERGHVLRLDAELLLHLAQDLDALDRVDAQLRLQRHVHLDHLRLVPRLGGEHGQHRLGRLLRRHARRRGGWRRRGGRRRQRRPRRLASASPSPAVSTAPRRQG